MKSDKDVFVSQLRALDEAHGIPSTHVTAPVNEKWKQSHLHGMGSNMGQIPLQWVFDLEAFKFLEHAEQDLVFGRTGISSMTNDTYDEGRRLLEETSPTP